MKVIVEKKRKKRISITVNAKGEVVVRAPLRATQAQISECLKRYEKWIQARLADYEAHLPNWSDGSIITLFGEEYVVRSGKARREGNVLYLPQQSREQALKALITALAKERMVQVTKELATQFSLYFSMVRISSARARWGSCNTKGEISYSFRVAFLPEELSRLVAAHELCHTLHFNHGASFWKEVERMIPGYKLLNQQLKSMRYFMNYL